jgi:hypothetical protein
VGVIAAMTKTAKAIPSREQLLSELSYDPDIGEFKWLYYKPRRRRSLVAGTMRLGYVSIKLGQIVYPAHRLAWVITHGPIPFGMEIDHINRNRSDNRISNLRIATTRENLQNKGRPEEQIGTTFHKACRKWQAQIEADGVCTYLGLFETQKEARFAYLKALENVP